MEKIYKFSSKIANLTVVLKPGLEGNKAFGIQPVPGIYVKFKDGTAEIRKPFSGKSVDELYDMMKSHQSFGNTFVDISEGVDDPFTGERKSTEPQHEITEMKFGTPVSTINAKKTIEFGDAQKKAMKSMLVEMLNEMPTEELEAIISKRNVADLKKELPTAENVDDLTGSDASVNNNVARKPGRSARLKQDSDGGTNTIENLF